MRNGLTMYRVYLPNGQCRLVVAEDESDASMKAIDKWGEFPDRIDVAEYNMSEDERATKG